MKKELWEKYKCGDHLSDAEMEILLNDAKAALPYLEGRGIEFNLALVPTRAVINEIEGYLRHRKASQTRSSVLYFQNKTKT